MARFWKEGGMKGTMEEFLGGTPEQVPDVYGRASPLGYVRADEPPILTIHGDMDALVPLSQVELLDAKAKEVGASHSLVVRRGFGHAGFMRSSAVRGVIFDFFDRWLKKR